MRHASPRHNDGRRRVRWRSGLAAFSAAALLVVVAAPPAHAVYYAGGMADPTYNIKPYGLNSTWTSPMEAARLSWNTGSTKLEASLNSAATARAVPVNFPNETWFGRYLPNLQISFTIQLNQPRISADPPFSTSLRSCFAHELGHSWSLGDIPSGGGNSSVMSYTRQRHVIFKPTSADFTEANGYY